MNNNTIRSTVLFVAITALLGCDTEQPANAHSEEIESLESSDGAHYRETEADEQPFTFRSFSTCEWDVELSAANQATHIGVCDSGRDLVSGGCKMTNNANAVLHQSYAMEADATDLENNDPQGRGNRWRCTYTNGTGIIQVTMLCCNP